MRGGAGGGEGRGVFSCIAHWAIMRDKGAGPAGEHHQEMVCVEAPLASQQRLSSNIYFPHPGTLPAEGRYTLGYQA